MLSRRAPSIVLAGLCALTLIGVRENRVEAQIVQSGPLYQQRFFEDQLRPLIDPYTQTPFIGERLVYDYGAVLRYAGTWYEDSGPFFLGDFQNSRALHLAEIRPWFSTTLDGVHHGFIRGQFDYVRYNDGDEYLFTDRSEEQGPFVDIGFYRLDIDEAFRVYRGDVIDSWAADLSAGRQFLFVGRGLAYAMTADGVALDATAGDWGGLLFATKSVPHYDNIDITAPSFGRSDRRFYAAQLEYQGLDHHELYAYVVIQRDHSGEVGRVFDPAVGLVDLQHFDYDSEYWGIGANGEFLFGPPERARGIPNLEYYGELIFQTGKSFADLTTEDRERIRAWAVDLGLTYHWNTPRQPRLEFEYTRASGDPDRFLPHTALNGNIAGTTDEGFLGFG